MFRQGQSPAKVSGAMAIRSFCCSSRESPVHKGRSATFISCSARRNLQAPADEEMAGRKAPLSRPLHADQFIVDESGRTQVRRDHTQTNPPWHLSECSRTDQSDPRVTYGSTTTIEAPPRVASAAKVLRKVYKYPQNSETLHQRPNFNHSR